MTVNDPIKRICIVGAGPLGLAAAFYLKKLFPNKNYMVDIIEKSNSIGGLANSLELSNGEKIESYYHHIFKTDKDFIKLSADLGLNSKIIFKNTSVGHYIDGKVYNLSSPWEILKGNLLSPFNRLRFLIVAAYLKIGSNKFFNGIDALTGSKYFFGKEISDKIWIPLLKGKFRNKYKLVPFSWLASRIRDRTIKLGFMQNGFNTFYECLAEDCKKLGVNLYLNEPLKNVEFLNNNLRVNGKNYDLCLSTIGPYKEEKINNFLKIPSIDYLGAICIIFELDFNLNIPYWVNYCDEESPVLALINHRKLDKSKRYKNIYPVYCAAYIDKDSDFYKLKDEKIIEIFFKSLKKVAKKSGQNDNFNYKSVKISRTKYAQPLINPSIGLHPFISTQTRLFRASLHSIYPNDRGQNYSIKIGRLMAQRIDIFLNKEL